MYKTRRTVFRNVIIFAFVIGLCAGLIFQTNNAYARVSLSELQAQIEALQVENDEQQDQIDQLLDRVRLLEIGDVARFTDMGDGTIRDNDSGLIWLKDASCSDLPLTDSSGRANWGTAKLAAADLYGDGSGIEICGLNDGSAAGDWRLPTKEEWEAFMSTDYDYPALVNTVGDAQWSEGDAFTGVQSDFYWSSTEYSSYGAWDALMFIGYMYYDSKDNHFYVWPVRSGN